MMFVMLVAGIGLVLAGLLAIGFGIPIKEFSTGNTLIITGVIGVCSGAIMFALWMAVRELKNIARRLGAGMPEARGEATVRPVLPVAAARDSAPADGGFRPLISPAVPEPFLQRHRRLSLRRACRHGRMRLSCVITRSRNLCTPNRRRRKPKRNLLFSSTSRKERERAQARTRAAVAGPVVVRPSPEAAHRAAGRNGRTASGTVRRYLAEGGTRKARRHPAAAAQPHAPDAHGSR